MSTCSNCGALFPPDETECPECGIENDRSGLRNRVDSHSTASETDEESANRDNGSAVDQEYAADELRSGQEIAPLRSSESMEVKKLEKTARPQVAESDIPQTNNRGPKPSFGNETERSHRPTSWTEDPAAVSEPRSARDREPENRTNKADGSAAVDESRSAIQNEVLPPAYGSVALAAAAEMEHATSEDQSSGFPEESEHSALQLSSEAQEDRDAAVAQTDGEHQREKLRSTSSSDSIPPPRDETAEQVPIPVRPPVLASEALREQLAPTEPGRNTIRVLSVVVGSCGAAIMLVLLGTNGMGLPLAGAFLALTAFALPSIPYAPRAAAVFTISASTLGVVTWMYVGTTGTPAEIVETIGVVTLGIALLFRAWHRTSVVARILVAVGILVCIGWLGMSGWLKDFTTLDPAWQSWLPTIIRAPFGLLLMLSLLAFMDARTTGGCGIWATAVWLWHALHMTVQLMILVWPKENRIPNWQLLSGDLSTITAASIASPLLALLVIFGVAQLLAVAFNVEVRTRQ
jgi:hypothetical protein